MEKKTRVIKLQEAEIVELKAQIKSQENGEIGTNKKFNRISKSSKNGSRPRKESKDHRHRLITKKRIYS